MAEEIQIHSGAWHRWLEAEMEVLYTSLLIDQTKENDDQFILVHINLLPLHILHQK